MVIFISIKMKVDMWTLELGLVDKFGGGSCGPSRTPEGIGRKKSPEGVPLLLLLYHSQNWEIKLRRIFSD
jgi:hypothetical protein